MTETTVESKNCTNCGIQFDITDMDLEFYDKISPVFDGKKYQIPSPKLCPACREQRRLAWRNERKLYSRKSDMSGKNLISVFAPESPYKVFDSDEWWSDNWDPMNYGMEFDFNKTFFEQFEELSKQVPQISMIQSRNENSAYANFAEQEKDCYLIFASNRDERCMYSSYIRYSKDCIDCLQVENSEYLYDCVDCKGSYNMKHAQKCHDCNNVLYSYDCMNCNNIIGCCGLRNKSYCVLNKQVTKEEFHELQASSHKIQAIVDEYLELKKHTPRLFTNTISSENVTGDYLNSCKNCFHCFNAFDCENGKYVENAPGEVRNVYDISGTASSELEYEVISVADAFNTHFCLYSHVGIKNSYYTLFCMSGSHYFGCVGLRDKEYCILNKQYTKEEYEQLVPKIIKHMKTTGERGEFFPISISPYAYNETVAQDFYPIDQSEAEEKGYKRLTKEYPVNVPAGMETIEAKNLPEIRQLAESGELGGILDKAVICEVSGKPYRIIKAELDYYIKHGIELPRKHPERRHAERLSKINKRTLYERKCDKCGLNITTTYSPERDETVYCEQCYEKEIY